MRSDAGCFPAVTRPARSARRSGVLLELERYAVELDKRLPWAVPRRANPASNLIAAHLGRDPSEFLELLSRERRSRPMLARFRDRCACDHVARDVVEQYELMGVGAAQ